ncbi:hypothetical protein LSAT2_025958 [Lamellibrachia satsuma]|nr:hypothetical protein LSAT2_025958 [Lamellibrachia satsuma]
MSEMFQQHRFLRCCLVCRRTDSASDSHTFMVTNHKDNKRKSAGRVCMVNGLLLTPCAVAVPSSRVFWHRRNFYVRQPLTPPHIARHRSDVATSSV